MTHTRYKKKKIDQNTLDLLKTEIIEKIDNFISKEKVFEYYEKGFVNFFEAIDYLSKDYVREGRESELRLTFSLHRAVVAFTGDPLITSTAIGEILKFTRLGTKYYKSKFSIRTLRKMVNLLEAALKLDTNNVYRYNQKYDFVNRLTLSSRQEIYRDTLNEIENYMEEVGIDRPKMWYKENVKAYHITRLLEKFLGFDILTFTTLDKRIFIKSEAAGKVGNFARHHFRMGIFRKLSAYVQDIILTSRNIHNKYKSYSESETLVIIEGFEEMMQMKGSGTDSAITRSDIINIFTRNKWVLYGQDGLGGPDKNEGWFFSGKFDEMLIEFNERKNLLQNEGIGKLLEKKYDTVYERFYLKFPYRKADGFYSIVFPLPTLSDFAMGMNFDTNLLYPEY